MNQGCNLPPAGWYCTRAPGHEGPCAALPKRTGLDDGPPLPHPRVLERVYREIEEKYPKQMATEDEKQKYFEEGYDQCFREVIEEIESWKHPDTKSFTAWLSKTFKSSAAKL